MNAILPENHRRRIVESYLGDPKIRRLRDELVKIHSMAMPKYLLRTDAGDLTFFYDEETQKLIMLIQSQIDTYVLQNYPALVDPENIHA